MIDNHLRQDLIKSYEARIAKTWEKINDGYRADHLFETIQYCEEKIKELKGEKNDD